MGRVPDDLEVPLHRPLSLAVGLVGLLAHPRGVGPDLDDRGLDMGQVLFVRHPIGRASRKMRAWSLGSSPSAVTTSTFRPRSFLAS